ncbi:uncharacterized protein MYCFIDRAFT_177050 [Pseudocercospora fijiensis CIRAD86]|uniref:Uncharacterized protein n=1 Tax=Pseudocercospora fijiensis (strain CIRAD86) TaxID=383855 RepID=M3A623_PSEFD|nr:uncharacterized protein MYCFIDRAFT_177050 [Pseudocercospora fijiensis CIRAD86]EME80066.1 hypothetical protein MYCFIDRAFT_177050 [Pseudocercospora fijiensis CIRAD86]
MFEVLADHAINLSGGWSLFQSSGSTLDHKMRGSRNSRSPALHSESGITCLSWEVEDTTTKYGGPSNWVVLHGATLIEAPAQDSLLRPPYRFLIRDCQTWDIPNPKFLRIMKHGLQAHPYALHVWRVGTPMAYPEKKAIVITPTTSHSVPRLSLGMAPNDPYRRRKALLGGKERVLIAWPCSLHES